MTNVQSKSITGDEDFDAFLRGLHEKHGYEFRMEGSPFVEELCTALKNHPRWTTLVVQRVFQYWVLDQRAQGRPESELTLENCTRDVESEILPLM